MRALLPYITIVTALAFASLGCRRRPTARADAGAMAANESPSSSSTPAKSTRTLVNAASSEGGADELIHLNRYTPGARQLVQAAQTLADARHHKMTTTLHLMNRYLDLPPVQKSFRDVSADPERAAKMVNQELGLLQTASEPSFLSPDALAVLQRAEREAGTREVSLSDLINASVADPTSGSIADLDRHGVTASAELVKIRRIVLVGHLDRILPAPP